MRRGVDACTTELNACQFADGSSASLTRFDDADCPRICPAADVVARATPRPCVTGPRCRCSGVDVRADPEPELGAWACRRCALLPTLGSEGLLPVPAVPGTAASRSAKDGSRTPQDSTAARTPVCRRTPAAGPTQSSTFRRVDDTAFCRYRDTENGWSTSVYAEHYRRHCTVENVGRLAVGERTLADLDPADDPYLRKLPPAA